MEEPSLQGCWAKHRRARDHAKALQREIDGFADSRPYRVTHEFNRDERAIRFAAETLKEPDTQLWGIILGDVVHNLRSALDHLVWQLALLDTGETGAHLQFPIESTGVKYWSPGKNGRQSVRDHRLAGVSGAHRAIIDRVQPYRAGENPHTALSVLADLSNTDKHCFVHATVMSIDPRTPGVLVPNEDAGAIELVELEPFPLHGSADLGRVVYSCPGPDPHVDVQDGLSVCVALGKAGVNGDCLNVILDAVSDIVSQFVADFQ